MLPEEFLRRMEKMLGSEYPDFLQSYGRPRAAALRFAPGRGQRPELPFLLGPVPWEPEGVYCDPEARPGLHPCHEAGVFYLQEASAMAPCTLLDPQPGELVLDLCAAPGGKSTQIAGRMAGKGLLVCNEYSPKRARILSQNVERMGIPNALVLNETPQALSRRFPGIFHRVLVDAPCSGEGMFRKEAAAVEDWSPETVRMCAQRQREILEWAGQMVRPGGRLVYSTCTFAPEEDEETVAWFLETHRDFSPEAVDAPWFTPGENGTFRLWPHKLWGEGHFAAVLRKASGTPGTLPEAAGQKLPACLDSFVREQGIVLPPGKCIAFGGTLYWVPPETPPLDRLRVLRPGLELGTVKGDRFLPAHALSHWMAPGENALRLPYDSPELRRYLHGETLPWTGKGWILVCAGDYGLGWGKGDGTTLKNHYPKGLRRLG